MVPYAAVTLHRVGVARDVLDRKLQAERSAEILANSTYPVVMLSYITNPPGSRDYKTIVNRGNVKVCVVCVCACVQNECVVRRTLTQMTGRDGASICSTVDSSSQSALLYNSIPSHPHPYMLPSGWAMLAYLMVDSVIQKSRLVSFSSQRIPTKQTTW